MTVNNAAPLAPGHGYASTPVLELLRLGAQHTGESGQRLLDQISRDYPASLEKRAAHWVSEAGVKAEDLDALLAASGFTDTLELQARASQEMDQKLTEPDLLFTDREVATGARSSLKQFLHRAQENLTETLENLRTNGALELAAKALLEGRRRWVLGDMKSAAYAQLLAFDLGILLRDVTLIGANAASALDALLDANREDVLVVFSFRNYSTLTLRVAEEFHKTGGTIIAFTDSYDSPICAFSDHVLAVNTASDSSTHSPTAVVGAAHVLSSLAGARAKAAARRGDRRGELIRSLGVYRDADGSPG